MKELELKIRELLKNNIENPDEVDGIRNEDSLEKLGINSIIFIKIVVELESEFDIEFEDYELDFSKFSSLNDVINLVKEKQVKING